MQQVSNIYNYYKRLKESITNWLIKREKEKHYINKLNNCTTYANWKKFALILDSIQNNNNWKLKKHSSLYDYQELDRTLYLLKQKRQSNESLGLVHILRSCLSKNFCNINYPALYCYSLVSTKRLIEEFILEREKCLIYLFNLPEKEFSIIKKIEFFEEAKISYGQTAIVFSGGAIFGLYHIGISLTLMELNLLPNVICGSSVGSVIASIICCLNYEEQYAYITRKHEEYDGPFHTKNYNDSFLTKIYKLAFRGTVHDVEVLKSYIRELLGDITFKEAYIKTGKILNINVSGYKKHEQSLILNFITSPNVLVFSAVAASSAAPIMFGPTELLCKNEYGQIIPYSIHRKQFIDGSLTEDVPTGRVRELFNINTFIVSQVNPWVFPFIDDQQDVKKILSKKKFSFTKLLKNLILSEIIHRLKQIQSILPENIGRWLNLATQTFTGDITITPSFDFKDLLKLTTNPKEYDYHQFKVRGSKRTFKKISQIEDTLRTEILLEKINKSLRTKMNQDVLLAKSYKNEEDIEETNNHYNNNIKNKYNSYMKSDIKSMNNLNYNTYNNNSNSINSNYNQINFISKKKSSIMSNDSMKQLVYEKSDIRNNYNRSSNLRNSRFSSSKNKKKQNKDKTNIPSSNYSSGNEIDNLITQSQINNKDSRKNKMFKFIGKQSKSVMLNNGEVVEDEEERNNNIGSSNFIDFETNLEEEKKIKEMTIVKTNTDKALDKEYSNIKYEKYTEPSNSNKRDISKLDISCSTVNDAQDSELYLSNEENSNSFISMNNSHIKFEMLNRLNNSELNKSYGE